MLLHRNRQRRALQRIRAGGGHSGVGLARGAGCWQVLNAFLIMLLVSSICEPAPPRLIIACRCVRVLLRRAQARRHAGLR